MEAVAKLNNYPTSPRKMRLLADLIRGMEVEKALGILQFNPKHPATPLYKLLESAINNWKQKNAEENVEDAGLVVKTIMVDGGRVIKRMRPAPQGRGYRIRKRSNHVTIIVDTADAIVKPVSKRKQRLTAAPAPQLVEVEEEVKEEKVVKAKKTATKSAAKPESKAKAKTSKETTEKTTKNKTK